MPIAWWISLVQSRRMCGRIKQTSDIHRIAAQFGVRGALPNIRSRWNGAPTHDFAVVRRNPEIGEFALDALRWGLVPRWAREEKISYSTFNAKAETLAGKSAFSGPWKHAQRCVIPVDAFYEWKAVAGEKRKQPYAISRGDGSLLALAGLWEGKKLADESVLRTFTIITTAANQFMAQLHDRMPVILDEADVAGWLGADSVSLEDASALMKPCPDNWLAIEPVDPRMSNVRNQDAEFCQPMSLAT